jgi:hypothetical protein
MRFAPLRQTRIAFDESGRLFVSAHIWTGEQHATGILRQEADGTYARIAGEAWGSTDEGVAATSAQLELAALGFDAAGDLWVAEGPSNIVRRIDMTDGNIYTMAGNRGATGGDYGPAAGARCNRDIVAHPDGHIVFADSYNYAVRMIW